MRPSKKIATIAAMLGAVCLAGPVCEAADTSKLEVAISALSGRILSAFELVRIYSGKTWDWKDGAAYFEPDRHFKAWLTKDAERSYGEGSWSVSDNGQLCIRATWHAASGDTKTFTCYVHRTGDAIYQREVPRGSWYLFSHIPPHAGDEAKELESGDHVSAEYEKAKKYVTKNLHARVDTPPNGRTARPVRRR